jgi:hypothetical protein
MHYLHPWFIALKQSTSAFKLIMTELGVEFVDDWATKKSVVKLIQELCKVDLKQREIWYKVYNSRKGMEDKYDFLFPDDPEYGRKRQWCHLFEAWYSIAVLCQKYGCLHLWLGHFNLSESYDLVEAEQIIIIGPIVVNGLHVEGTGIIKL